MGSFEWTQDEKDIFYYLYEKAQEKGDINYQEYILGSLYRKVAEKIWSHGNNKKVWEFYIWEVLKDESLMNIFNESI